MSVVAEDFVHLVEVACRAGQRMAGVALSDAFGNEITVEVIGHEPLRRETPPDDLQGPACFIVLEGEHYASVLVIPSDLPFVPAWCQDAQQVAERLDGLARQLHVLLPDFYRVVHSWATWVPNAVQGLLTAGIGNDAQRVTLRAKGGNGSGKFSLIWPCEHVERLLLGDAQAGNQEFAYTSFEEGMKKLPAYMRSLLRIRVPVAVVLASASIPLRRLLEIGPGVIIAFKKPCDDTLSLEVGGHVIAVGEAVRVGNRFGLWITSMAMPQARFHKVVGKAAERERQRRKG